MNPTLTLGDGGTILVVLLGIFILIFKESIKSWFTRKNGSTPPESPAFASAVALQMERMETEMGHTQAIVIKTAEHAQEMNGTMKRLETDSTKQVDLLTEMNASLKVMAAKQEN